MNQFKHTLSEFLSKLKALKGKKIAIIIAASILLIAPSLLATGYVIYHEIAKPVEYFSVTLYDSDEQVIANESKPVDEIEQSQILKIFYHILFDEKEETIKSKKSDERFVRAEIDHNGTKHDIICYFSTDPDTESYYVDSQGEYYPIPQKLNDEFLCTEYGETFYKNARSFDLTTADLDVITPQNIDWHYKTVDGQYRAATKNSSTKDITLYEITGAIDIEFDLPPDITTAQVFSNDRLVYTGTAEALASLEVSSSDVIRVCIEAKWLQINHREYYGTANYEFLVHIKNRASFSISSDTVRSGGFIIIDCYNINNIKKLNVTSSRSEFTPVFKPYNNRWRTIIPFPEILKESTLNLTFSYGATAESFSIQVLPPAVKDDFITEAPVYNDSYNSDTVSRAILSAKLPENSSVYFRGNFEDPQADNYTALYYHGASIICNDTTYTAIGNQYILNDTSLDGGSVRAIQSGTVAYVGNSNALGSFAVIDHGCGLRTWYTGLSKIDVSVGDILLTGQHIGKTGKTNVNDAEGFTLFCTVNDVIIDPETLWKK